MNKDDFYEQLKSINISDELIEQFKGKDPLVILKDMRDRIDTCIKRLEHERRNSSNSGTGGK